MDDDEEKFNENIKGYNNYIKDFGELHEKGAMPKVSHKFNFLTEDVKMLSYKEEIPVNVVVKKKENTEIDIMKLMKYTKRGQSAKWFSPSASSGTGLCFKGEKPMSLMSKTGSDFRSTRMTVKSEAEKAGAIDETFAKKRENMEHYFKYADLPRAEDYEELIRVKSRLITPSHLGNSLTETQIELKKIISPNNGKRNIISSFRRKYNDKARKWKIQDEQFELKKMNDLKKKKEISVFLKKIKQLERNPQYYIDGYSRKDGITNQRINQFNQSLSSAFHSKKVIEKNANRFNNQSNFFKKVSSLNTTEKIQLNEGDEVSRKIRLHLQREEDEKEDINLNYQVFAQRIEGRNNEQKLDPYKEFMDFKAQVAEKDLADITNTIAQGSGLSTTKSMKKMTSNFESISSPVYDRKYLSPTVSAVNEICLEKEINNNDNSNTDMKFILLEKVKEPN